MGLTLDEIRLANTPASFEPALDYVVTKVARFPFDKFSDASNKLGTQMKATGEVMSIGRTMEESLLKAMRSLETGVCHIYHKKFDKWSNDDLLAYIKEGTDDRLYAISQLIRNGVDLALIYNNTKIDMFFLEKFKNIIEFEAVVRAMKEAGIGYGAINHPIDRDPVCGYTGIIGEVCPRCGRREGEGVPLSKLQKLGLYKNYNSTTIGYHGDPAEEADRQPNTLKIVKK